MRWSPSGLRMSTTGAILFAVAMLGAWFPRGYLPAAFQPGADQMGHLRLANRLPRYQNWQRVVEALQDSRIDGSGPARLRLLAQVPSPTRKTPGRGHGVVSDVGARAVELRRGPGLMTWPRRCLSRHAARFGGRSDTVGPLRTRRRLLQHAHSRRPTGTRPPLSRTPDRSGSAVSPCTRCMSPPGRPPA